MRNKSLVYRTCDPYTLCGISSCFRLLSPTHRQVIHALLTRPPLTSARKHLSVRLECVKHAASVHPEPGSNSLKKLFHSILDAVNIFSELVLLFLLFSLGITSCNRMCVLLRNQRVISTFLVFFVVQFSRFNSCPLSPTAYAVYHTLPRLSTPFSNFLEKFFDKLDCDFCAPLRLVSLSIITHSSAFVNTFFSTFFISRDVAEQRS